MSYSEKKICLDAYSRLLKAPGWHDALKINPEPGTYTVIVNQYLSTGSAWIRNGYRFDGEHWLTPKGKISTAPVLAWYEEDE